MRNENEIRKVISELDEVIKNSKDTKSPMHMFNIVSRLSLSWAIGKFDKSPIEIMELFEEMLSKTKNLTEFKAILEKKKNRSSFSNKNSKKFYNSLKKKLKL